MPYESISKRLAQLPSLEEGLEECPFICSQRLDLINELTNRPLGPSGRRLLNFLQTGEGQPPELEQLLRRVCSKIKQQVWSPKDGFMVDSDLLLDPDEVLDSMPRELAEERQYEAILRFSYGIQPLPGDYELCRDVLKPDELKELQARLEGSKMYPYQKSPDRLSFEPMHSDLH